MLGEADEGPWTDEDPDREFHYRLAEPLSVTIEDYQALARSHDELFAGFELGRVAVERARAARRSPSGGSSST